MLSDKLAEMEDKEMEKYGSRNTDANDDILTWKKN